MYEYKSDVPSDWKLFYANEGSGTEHHVKRLLEVKNET